MRVAIIGGGVAGVSAGIALARNGHDVTVYERRSAPGTIGAGVVCWPNASYVLSELGVLQTLTPLSGRPTEMCRLTARGERLGVVDIRALDECMGSPSLSVLRSDLMAALLGRLQTLGVRVRYGLAVTHLAAGERGRARIFVDDGENIDADVVIGADGRMMSRARAFVHGDARPIYQRFVNWIGVFESSVPHFSAMQIQDFWGHALRFGVVPLTPHRAYWAAAAAAPSIGSNDRAAYRDEVRTLFGSWPEPIPTLIADTPVQRMNKIYVHDHDPIACWHRDNVVLIGDAAHAPLPTSGQGACQALEDSLHLAQALEDAPGQVDAAFVRFTTRRSEKTARICHAGRQLARSLFTVDPSLRRRRDEAARTQDYGAMVRGMTELWSSGLALPNTR